MSKSQRIGFYLIFGAVGCAGVGAFMLMNNIGWVGPGGRFTLESNHWFLIAGGLGVLGAVLAGLGGGKKKEPPA